MKLVTAQEMQDLDRTTIEEVGIPGVVLMENAGQAVVDTALEMLSDNYKTEVIVLAGKGNNGGDGFVVARLLANLGIEVRVFVLGETTQISGDTKVNLNILHKLGFEIEELQSLEDLQSLTSILEETDLIIDGILGTGIKGGLRGLAPDLIKLTNDVVTPVLAIDIPSGLNADSGRPHGVAVKADATVTFALPKLGLLLYPGREYVGDLEVADISIPDQVVARKGIKRELITPELAKELLPKREDFSYKGTYGHALVVAGSVGMTGAAKLSSLATLKSGTGIVTLGIPKSLNVVLEEKLTEVMTKPLPENRKGCLSLNALSNIKKLSKEVDVMAVGPGLSQSEEMTYILHDILTAVDISLIIDADGLNAIDNLDLLADREVPTVLTPHPGEMARLTGRSIKEVQEDRVKVAVQLAQELDITLVLKGAATLVALSDGRVYVNSSGNSGLATAGSGDVLTGVITGLVAQGLSPSNAAILGVFLHGLAGDLQLEVETAHTLVASDLITGLSKAFNYLVR